MIGNRFVSAVLVVAAVAAFAIAPALAKKPVRVVSTAEELDKLIVALRAEAEQYAKAPGDAAPPESTVTESVHFTPAVADALAEALRHDPKADPLEELFVACHLVTPLAMAKDELISKLQPELIGLLGRAQFRKLPSPDQQTLADLNPPAKSNPADAQRYERLRQAALDKKHADEQAVVRHNRLARQFQQAVKAAMILPGDEKADKALTALLTAEIEDQWDTYAPTLEVIKARAVGMKPEQAKRYYECIRDLAKKHPSKRPHADPTSPRYDDKAASTFATKEMWFARDGLNVANLLATAAREPALIVPGEKTKPPRR